MDEFEKRLKQDAEAIRTEVSPQLRGRIDASLRAATQAGKERASHDNVRQPTQAGLWWMSSLTGLAAAVLVIVLINMNQPAPGFEGDLVAELPTVPDSIRNPMDLMSNPAELDVQAAEFTASLEEELIRLQADIERARQSVREDIDFTF